jgi:release factor glutamine methyltransferase
MTISEAGKKLLGALSSIYSQRESANIVALVMEKITGYSKSERLVHKQLLLDAVQQSQFDNFKAQLLQHKPVQYVLHEAWFCGLQFYVDESVLIPRPETEELVETILQDNTYAQNLSILDIGTGSGCIAISLKKKLQDTILYALDISEKALDIAKENASKNSSDIVFFHSDILHFKETNLPVFDIIVSNPPYITQAQAMAMHPNVLLHEPHTALFVPDEDALLFYKAIADFGLQHLKPGGKLYFEVNELLGGEVSALLKLKGFSHIQVKKDLQQKNRIVSASLL